MKEAATEAALLLFFVWQPDHEASAAPKLNVGTFQKALGLLDCFDVVGANQRIESYEMTVAPDGVGPVLCHPKVPTVGSG
jgi:hypothetical protein